jgi:hypothetical protein
MEEKIKKTNLIRRCSDGIYKGLPVPSNCPNFQKELIDAYKGIEILIRDKTIKPYLIRGKIKDFDFDSQTYIFKPTDGERIKLAYSNLTEIYFKLK